MGAGQTFNYSFSTDKRGSAPNDLFAVAGLGEFHLGGEAMLARNPGNGRRMVLAAEMLNALTHCTFFRTLDEHVANLLEGGDGAAQRAGAIRAILQSVRDGGLVLAAADLCREIAPAPDSPAAPAAPVVAIITCDRSAALQRLLQSIATACDLGQVHHFYVVDDSRATDQQQGNHELTRRFGTAAPCPVGYVGADAARQFSDETEADPRRTRCGGGHFLPGPAGISADPFPFSRITLGVPTGVNWGSRVIPATPPASGP